MKLKCKLFFISILCLSLFTSCNKSKSTKAIIEREEGIQTVITIDSSTFKEKLSNTQSFILFFYQETCLCSKKSRSLLNNIVSKKQIRIYEINQEDFEKNFTKDFVHELEEMAYGYPKLTIFNNGYDKKTCQTINIDKHFGNEIDAPNNEESINTVLDYIEKYAFLDSPFFEETDKSIKEKINNKKSFYLYFKRNSCPDCKKFNSLFLDKWIINNKENYIIYTIDIDLYKDSDPIKNDYGFERVPTIQKYQNGSLVDMAVIYNDEFEETEDNKYKVTDGYYDEFIGQIFADYTDYYESVTDFYITKFLEILK